MDDFISVGIADYKISKGKQSLITRDLGSCVAVAIRDPDKKIAGLLHIMLPCSSSDTPKEQYPKYADSGIALMVNQMCLIGANRKNLVAKLAGAAHIIKTPYVPESEDISSRNLAAVKRKLAELSIPVLKEEVEDDIPRTVIFDPETGTLLIKTIGHQDKTI